MLRTLRNSTEVVSVTVLGFRSYQIELTDGTLVRRHVDSIRQREWEDSPEDTGGDSSTAGGFDLGVTLTAPEGTAEVATDAPAQGGPAATEDTPATHQGTPGRAPAIPALTAEARRSTRARQRPDYLHEQS